MTNEAIEAAARAIWEQQCQHWGRYRDSIPDLCAWEELTESKQREVIREARAAAPALMEEGARLALEAMRWRPIDSAPEDGDMLVRNGDVVAVAFRDSGMSSYRFFSPVTHRDLDFGPTEWMPIPDAAALDPAAIVKGAGHDRG